MTTYQIKPTHISNIKTGDTIISPDGHMRTISKSNISYDPFLGYRINGDSYQLGTIPVNLVIFNKPK